MSADLVHVDPNATRPAESEAVAPSAVMALRQVIAQLDTQRSELAEAGDIDSLAHGLAQVRQILGDLRTLASGIEDDVVALMPAKTYTVEGVGTLERRRGSDRKRWQSDDLVTRLVTEALVDENGEVRHSTPVEGAAAAVGVLLACAPFTASMGWRVTALRDHGIDPDEWCEVTPGRTSVQIHGEQDQ